MHPLNAAFRIHFNGISMKLINNIFIVNLLCVICRRTGTISGSTAVVSTIYILTMTWRVICVGFTPFSRHAFTIYAIDRVCLLLLDGLPASSA